MRPSFEKNLTEYSRLIHDQMSAEDAQELEKLQTVVDYHFTTGSDPVVKNEGKKLVDQESKKTK